MIDFVIYLLGAGLLGYIAAAALMATVGTKCPECRGTVPSDASKCMHCGGKLTPKPKRDRKPATWLQTGLLVGLLVLAMFLPLSQTAWLVLIVGLLAAAGIIAWTQSRAPE